MRSHTDNRVRRLALRAKSIAPYAFALFLAGLATAPQHSFAAVDDSDTTVEYLQDRSSVDVAFEYWHGELLVRVDVGDKQGLVFLLDTGSSECVVDPSIGVSGTTCGTTQVRVATGVVSARYVRLSRIHVSGSNGSLDLKNPRVLEMDLSNIGTALNRKIDGILGMPFIAGYLLDINYKQKLLTFRSAESASDPANDLGVRAVEFAVSTAGYSSMHRRVLISGKLQGGEPCEFLLDTGFGGSVSISESAARHSGMLSDADTQKVSRSFTVGGSFQTASVRSSGVTLGSLDLSNSDITVDLQGASADHPAQVGNRFLEKYLVRLDSAHSKLWLASQSGTE